MNKNKRKSILEVQYREAAKRYFGEEDFMVEEGAKVVFNDNDSGAWVQVLAFISSDEIEGIKAVR